MMHDECVIPETCPRCQADLRALTASILYSGGPPESWTYHCTGCGWPGPVAENPGLRGSRMAEWRMEE